MTGSWRKSGWFYGQPQILGLLNLTPKFKSAAMIVLVLLP
jgi:hypothetical protein